VSTLPAIAHFDSLPSPCCHAAAELPLKRMIASEGASVLVVPGLITLGTGFHISVVAEAFCAKR
jgi:hypothetical protein